MIGQTISHYRILEKLGEGGMGEVCLAEDAKLKRKVALKFLPRQMTADLEARERFEREAQAAAALNHPNIVTVYEIGEHEGQVFIAMEYVEGQTLKELISGVGARCDAPSSGDLPLPIAPRPLPLTQVIDIAAQIAAGLAAAHAKGIVHRDVKPQNILIDKDNRVKILDFGLAKLKGVSSLTKETSTLGTVHYMSPEQTLGKEVDHRTDIWSLGVILYEMLAGETPFKGEYMQAVVYSILNEEPKPLAQVRSDMPPGLEPVITKALAKNPKDRYQNINDLAANLKAAGEGTQPIRSRPAAFRANILSKKTLYLSIPTAALAVLFAINVGGVRRYLLGPAAAPARAIRLAVLPFANLSGDPEQEYFSDGLTQEMIARLGKLHPQSMSLIARTSVMHYKKSDVPIDRIGRELGVEYVLEGSARREGSRVKVTAELIRVKDQTQLWVETYEREMSSILALQSDVAGKVAGVLALKLLPAEQPQLAGGHAVDPEAYEAYLKGSYYRQTLTRGGLEAAERYFRLAMEKDPNFAAAWAGIASVWISRQQMGLAPPKEAFARAREAALKALALDDSECEARRVMAGILTWGDWNWDAAERAWKRVFEINPDYTPALSTYSHFLMVMGRQDKAMAKIERALELDPFDIKTLSFHSMVLLFARRYDEAIAAAHKALKLQSDAPVARTALIGALFMKGQFDELMAIERSRWAKDRNLLEALEQGFAEGGYPDSQKRLAHALAARYGKPGGVTAFTLANLYAHAGEKDRVIEWLERAYDAGDGNMPYIGLPVFDLVRSDPRFQAILRRMHLPAGAKK